TNPIFAE
ncbi:ATP-dependent DNA helicase, RecQ family protein, partial [Vibrio parahaemolyticus 10296]